MPSGCLLCLCLVHAEASQLAVRGTSRDHTVVAVGARRSSARLQIFFQGFREENRRSRGGGCVRRAATCCPLKAPRALAQHCAARVTIMRLPLQARCLQTGVSLLLASQCFLGALPGFAEPVALAGAPAAVEQLASSSQAAMPPAAAAPAPGSASQSALQGLMSLEQARQLGALQDMGSLPSDEKVALRKVSVTNSQVPATHLPCACHALTLYLSCTYVGLLFAAQGQGRAEDPQVWAGLRRARRRPGDADARPDRAAAGGGPPP